MFRAIRIGLSRFAAAPRRLLAVALLSPALSLLAAAPALAAPPPAPAAAPVAAPKRFDLPPTTGPYQVGTFTLHIVDRARTDRFVGGPREYMVTVSYPVAPHARGARAPWLEPALVPEWSATAAGYGIAPETVDWAGARRPAILGAPLLRNPRGWPVVLFSPGLQYFRELYSSLTDDLASHGYVVASMTHTHEAFYAAFPGGRVVRGQDLVETVESTQMWLDTRVGDSRHLLDALALSNRGFYPGAGHGRLPPGWRGPRELALDLGADAAAAPALALPADATNVRVAFAQDAAAGEFSRWMDSLIDFPYGCVEQTSSRMLPLALALQSMTPAQQAAAPQLAQRLASARLALARMAGPEARFGWWGRGMSDDAFLTAYAYYADWRATQALHLELPASHWERLLETYAKSGTTLPPLQRALALAWMQEMYLPVAPMTAALVDSIPAPSSSAAAPRPASWHGSYALAAEGDAAANDMALVLAVATADRAHANLPAEARTRADAAAARLAASEAPFVRALLMASQRANAAAAPALLAQVGAQMPTFDRAQTLVWLQRALGRRADVVGGAIAGMEMSTAAMPAPWQRATGPSGDPLWRWPAAQPLPTSLALPTGPRPAWAYVDYDSAEPQAASLPVHIERTLWKVVALRDKPAVAASGAEGAAADDGRLRVRLDRVEPGATLSTDALYLDQLDVRADKPLRRALLEVALPPGAAVESGTWGIEIEGEGEGGKGAPLERAQQQDIAQGYAVPIDELAAKDAVSLRHLVRFSQRGQFRLPPARLYRMYDPDAKASEAASGWARIEIK